MRKILAISAVFSALFIYAQTGGGEMPFTFVNMPVSAVSQALSTACAAKSAPEGDIFNPASLGFSIKRDASFTYQSYIVSTYFGLVEYTDGSMKAGLKYFNSGSMEQRDSLNNYIGDFSVNMAYGTFDKAFKINDNLSWGANVLAGFESSAGYSNTVAAAGAGIIYKGYKDFLNFGFYASNLGVSYFNSSYEMLPARVLAGVGIEKEDIPVSVYIDAGKILDRQYFYAAGVEINFMKGKKEKKAEESRISDFVNDIEDSDAAEGIQFNEAAQAEAEPDSSAAVSDSAAVSSADASVSDSLAALPESAEDDQNKSAENEAEKTEYQSYADWIAAEEAKKDSMENAAALKELNGDVEAETELKSNSEVIASNDQTTLKKTEKGQSFSDDIKFVLRGGFSSDRSELQMGTGLDLVAGLTAGFTLGYKNIAVDYSVKQFGEAGMSHSIGIRYGF